jgi:hypothetical protein
MKPLEVFFARHLTPLSRFASLPPYFAGGTSRVVPLALIGKGE